MRTSNSFRRISAITVAERVADERAEVCGGADSSVGYQIRLDSRLPRFVVFRFIQFFRPIDRKIFTGLFL